MRGGRRTWGGRAIRHRERSNRCASVGDGARCVAAGWATGQDALRTRWGAPDLQGVWDFHTATPLERPEDRADQAFLTEEEAATMEQERVDRNIRLWEAAPRRTEAGGDVGGYNNFWLDFGTNVIEDRRTSLVVDPPTGASSPCPRRASGAPTSGASTGRPAPPIRTPAATRSTVASSGSTSGRR